MERLDRKKKNGFAISLGLIFWLGGLGFLAYRTILPVPPGRGKLYLAYTKFNGYQNQVLQPGQYYISWQNFLPGNVELLAIPYQVQELYLSESFSLPSAANYQVLLPDLGASRAQNPFEFRVGLQLRYRYRAEELLAFALNPANLLVPAAANHSNGESLQSENIGDEGQVAGTELTLRLENKLRKRLNQELLFTKVDKLIAGAAALEQYLKNVLARAFPELELLSLDVQEYRQPDLELYATVKLAYQDLLQKLSSKSMARLLEQQNHRLAQELYLQNIERLGKILSEYPRLIQYFAVTDSPLKGTLNREIIQKVLEQVEP